MVLPHPCSWIPERVRPRFFAVALLLTLAVLVALQRLGAPLRTAAAASGIVSFELAGTLSAAQEILRSWGVQGEKSAGINLGLDYLFLFAYAASIGLACILVADKFRGDSPIRVVGVLLSWALIVAATLDGIENYALISLLLGSINAALPALARSAALVKFALVFLGLMAILKNWAAFADGARQALFVDFPWAPFLACAIGLSSISHSKRNALLATGPLFTTWALNVAFVPAGGQTGSSFGF
jgi:hypothetical protein